MSARRSDAVIIWVEYVQFFFSRLLSVAVTFGSLGFVADFWNRLIYLSSHDHLVPIDRQQHPRYTKKGHGLRFGDLQYSICGYRRFPHSSIAPTKRTIRSTHHCPRPPPRCPRSPMYNISPPPPSTVSTSIFVLDAAPYPTGDFINVFVPERLT